MNYIFDTNILLIYFRNKNLVRYIDEKYNPLSFQKKPVISVVSLGEIKSIALKNGWGNNQQTKLLQLTNRFLIADINTKSIINRYAELDAFSQGKLKNKPLGESSRNMGKNDLWIAATASILDIPLITTDKDFIHLANNYLKLEYIDIKTLLN